MQLDPDHVRGLTLWQPWASLVACGKKRIETRCWRTSWRGLALVHSSQASTGLRRRELASSPAWKHLRAAGDARTYGELEHGAVLAIARVESCLYMKFNGRPEAPWPEDSTEPGDVERECGDFREGRWAWSLVDLVRLVRPVRLRGGQRLWLPSRGQLELVRAALPREAWVYRAKVDELAERIAP